MRTGWIALPDHLHGLAILANPWVIGVAAVGLVAEFFADKIMWLDSLWDGVHTLVRPVGGALLAMAIVDPQDQAWQIVSLLLGGSAALLTHGAKAGTRAVVNTSPEPVSNVAMSVVEDGATGTLLLLALYNPAMAIIIALFLAVAAIAVLLLLRRIWRRMRAISSGASDGGKEPPLPIGGS
jgi:energy-converting hydrogenase Eha subunit E